MNSLTSIIIPVEGCAQFWLEPASKRIERVGPYLFRLDAMRQFDAPTHGNNACSMVARHAYHGRNIWQGRIFSAYPVVVVADTADLIATYVPAGAGWKRPVNLQGRAIRIPHGEWRLRDEVWYGHGVLRIFIPGVAHSVLVFFGPADVDRWYINLEAPFQRTPIGLDARDQFLDVVFSSNLSTYRVKDEPELDEALSLGLIDAREAASIRAEAQRVIAWIQQGHPAIQDYWRWWQPPTSWTEPQLAPGWEMVD